MRGPQAAGGRRFQIVAVRRHHHAGLRRKIEGRAGRAIDHRLRLVVTRNLGAENGVPAKSVVARKIGHQRNIAVRYRREQEALAQSLQPLGRIRPGIEPMPGGVELAADILGQFLQAEVRPDAVEIAPMQRIELAEGDAARRALPPSPADIRRARPARKRSSRACSPAVSGASSPRARCRRANPPRSRKYRKTAPSLRPSRSHLPPLRPSGARFQIHQAITRIRYLHNFFVSPDCGQQFLCVTHLRCRKFRQANDPRQGGV